MKTKVKKWWCIADPGEWLLPFGAGLTRYAAWDSAMDSWRVQQLDRRQYRAEREREGYRAVKIEVRRVASKRRRAKGGK